MAASEPTSWLSVQFHILFHLTITWGPELSIWAVSLLTTDLITRSLTPVHRLAGIRSLIEFGKLCGPLAHSVLYLLLTNTRLALKLFRGEPAISKFDWNFSAIHRSSPPFSTDVWFGPPWCSTTTSTCPWIGHLVSGLRHATYSSCSDSLSLRLRTSSP